MDQLDNVVEWGEHAFLELFTTEEHFLCVILFNDVPPQKKRKTTLVGYYYPQFTDEETKVQTGDKDLH